MINYQQLANEMFMQWLYAIDNGLLDLNKKEALKKCSEDGSIIYGNTGVMIFLLRNTSLNVKTHLDDVENENAKAIKEFVFLWSEIDVDIRRIIKEKVFEQIAAEAIEKGL